ncbi:hepatitis A virus cellular receptor 1 isoform 2-T2 [Spinachia spinachia]
MPGGTDAEWTYPAGSTTISITSTWSLRKSTTSMMPTVDTTTDQDTTGHVTSTLHLPTSSSSGIMAEGSSSVSVVLVCVLLGLASLVAAALVVTALRRPRHGKTEPAVENVYQMEADGGEYESCP